MSSYYGDRDRDRTRERSSRSDRSGDSRRPNPCRLYVGKVSSYVREQDLRDLFTRFGRIRDLVLRDYYAFIEFDNVRDAEDAAKELNGHRLEGERLIVQVANRARDRGDRDSRDDRRDDRRDFRSDRDRSSAAGSDRCYNCGEFGHM
ncbi:hypothetical protein BDB01DRAFT_408516 [Pilobolus umbonatus]|nr:hypothetical protein BDB01DRAFT_408516 [Pilobolus umbonatus]